MTSCGRTRCSIRCKERALRRGMSADACATRCSAAPSTTGMSRPPPCRSRCWPSSHARSQPACSTAPSPSCRTAAPSRSQPTAPMGTTMMAATRTASALSARCARIPPGAISPSTQWRWISAETYAISTEAEPISQRAFCAASARRSAASARMRCGCCARAALPRSSASPLNPKHGQHCCAARRSASSSHASASPKKLRKRSAHRPRSGPLR